MVKAILPAPAAEASIGITSPASFRASTRRHRERGHRTRYLDARRLHRLPRLGADRASGLVGFAPRGAPPPGRGSTRARAQAADRVARPRPRRAPAPSRVRRPWPRDPRDCASYGERTSIHSPVSTHLPSDQDRALARRRGHVVSVDGAPHGVDGPDDRDAGPASRRPGNLASLCCGRCATPSSSMPFALPSGDVGGRSQRFGRTSSRRRS